MPASNTDAKSTLPSQLAAVAIHKRFAHRPSFFSVVFNALRDRIMEHYPTLEIDLRDVKLASPHPDGGWEFKLLSNVATEHVLNPQLLDLSPRRELPFYLTQNIPSRLKSPAPPYILDMQVIANIIAALPSTLYIYFQQALADHWSESDTQGSNRWQWFGEFLKGQMMAAAASRSDLDPTQRDMLSIVAAWPERLARLSRSTPVTEASFIETTLKSAGKEERLLTPDLLLIRGKQVLLYGVAGTIELFDSIDAFGKAWGLRMQRRFEFDSISWRRNEPDGNVFEQQAGLILNQQLEDLGTMKFQGQSERALERRLDTLTDPALLFSKVPEATPAQLEQVRTHLPEWVTQASVADRFAYHRHMQDMAQVLKQNQGRSFNEGIASIHTFSRDALRRQMRTDHGDQDPDDVVLDFSVAAGYPGGAGFIGHVKMSLTELALKNLAGKPKGTLKLSSKSGKALPNWLDADYVLGSKGLIQRVDIGATYPQKIKDLLLSDTLDARRRETLFTRELKVSLPTQALEFAMRKQHGVTVQGYRCVKAVLGETVRDRSIDGQEIVLRPLALCRAAGATPDTVNNIFIIEPRDTNVGPHLLYRPLYADCLYEYPTRQALLDAIATPGELQTSVLMWLTDKARPIFDHGGIKEPHIIRFTLGGEFDPYSKPSPATLAVDDGGDRWLQAQADGQLLNHLFHSTAGALVELADRDSVSNSESRWAIVMEGAWLLFNTLVLPLVQGPAMLAGWFLVLVSSLEQDLAGLDSDDPTTRELALIDLLLNTAMVLLHAASNPKRQPLPEPAAHDSNLHLASWLRSSAPHPETPPLVRQNPLALSGEPPATGRTALDFSRSLASAGASAKLLDALLSVHVPWPSPLPTPEASGRLKGLYRIDNLWHASVGGLLFQVSIEPGFGDVYLVDPKHSHHPGFQLASDGLGHWRLRRGVRLEGGMPRERVQRWRAENQDHLDQLSAQTDALRIEISPLIPPLREAREALQTSRVTLDKQKKRLRVLWNLTLADAGPEKKAEYLKKHEEQRNITAVAKAGMDIELDKYLDAVAAIAPLILKIVEKRTEQMAADLTNGNHLTLRNQSALMEFNNWNIAFDYLVKARMDLLELESGEHIDQLSVRINDELSKGITTAYNTFLNIQKQLLAIEEKQIPIAMRIEAQLDQADPALRQYLLTVTPLDQYVFADPLEQSKLLTLLELSIDRSFQPGEPVQFFLALKLMDSRILQSVLAHSEMRSRSGYSTLEKTTVLQDVLEHYKRVENAFNSLSDMRSGYIRDEYREAFLKQFSDARSSLESQLADLILVEEGFLPEPSPEKPVKAKTPNKRVINTSKGSLVGDLRPSDRGTQGRVVDVIDSSTGQTVASYQEQGTTGLWEEVNETGSATPQAGVPDVPAGPSVRSLKRIKADAEKIVNERARIEGNIRFEQRQLKDPRRIEDLRPWEWDHMLTRPAEQLESLVNEIQRGHAADANAVKLAGTYLAEAQAMKTQAREFCREGYLLQRPRASNIEYLLANDFVKITLVKTHFPLQAGDFLTEYAVHDKRRIGQGKPDDNNALWYAHFHYPTVDTPKLQPQFAHLKTHAERLVTRRQLFEQAQKDARAVINLNKEIIALPLAKKLFLEMENQK